MVLLELPYESKLFQFHGDFRDKLGKFIKSTPHLANLNPISKIPGSATAFLDSFLKESTDYN